MALAALVIDWKVTEVVQEGERLAQVTWTEKPDKDGNWQSGDVLLAPSQSWAIREFALNGSSAKATRPGSALSGTVKYEGEIDGIPLIKTVSFWCQLYDKRGEVERRWNVETYEVLSLKTERLPLSNFTMAAFGLSDPRERTAEKPTRWWLWAMAAGAGALVCAVGFSWLKRRASR